MLKSEVPISCDLVLIGGGHAHVAVLRSFGMRPLPGTRITMISRDAQTPYSGMLPGHLAGHYDRATCHIDLRPLCRFAEGRLYHTSAVGLDLDRRLVLCQGRPPVPFDVLSIDVGSQPSAAQIAGAAEHAIPVKPVDRFFDSWYRVERALVARNGAMRVVVVGGGAGGVEVSLALQYRLKNLLARNGIDATGLSFAVVTDTDQPLERHGAAVRRKMQRFLRARGIRLHTGRRVVAFEADRLRCEPEEAIAYDAAVLVTHAAAPAWLEATGLELDSAGFVRVRDTLQSWNDERVFAAGDVAALADHQLAKSGVFAVRQGPVLADNLRRVVERRPLRPYRPQRRTLALISSGDAYAVASYGALAFEGAWVWRLKDWIDRRWMRKYQELPKMAAPAAAEVNGLNPSAMRCGGCGAKIAGPVLGRVLDSLRPIARQDVWIGLDAADDAAVVEVPPDKVMVQSVDHFRAFIDDPYLFGRVTANHCLGDIYAMGAVPQAALALVSLPFAPEDKLEQDLRALLTGALETLNQAGAALIGGHTGEGAELAFGLSVNGLADRDQLLRKGGMRAGDVLVLTKPLGTGTIFAADMQGEAGADWVDGALAEMLVSSGPAAACLAEHGATACTDITGFGLLGHLIEMLKASGVATTLRLDALPALDGAKSLLAAGITSSFHPANQAYAAALTEPPPTHHDAYPLLYDPQTAGGLLASIPAERAQDCLARLHDLGYGNAVMIGEVSSNGAPAGTVALI